MTTYKYWVAGVKISMINNRARYFNEEMEVDFEVKTSEDVVKLQKEREQDVSINNVYFTSWPHLLGITRDGEYRPYVTMVKLD